MQIQETLAAALAHHQAGRLQQAESLYREILRVAPGNGDATYLLSIIALQVRNYGAALPLLEQVAAVRPDNAEVFNNLGVALKELARFREAAENFHKALALNPWFAEAYTNLGVALRALGDLPGSLANYRRALTIKPDHTGTMLNLGAALQANGEHREAEIVYRRVLQLDPQNAEAITNLGVVLGVLGQPEAEKDCYRRAIAVNPGYALAHSNLGSRLLSTGHREEAIACYRRALALAPADDTPRHMLAALTGQPVEHAPAQYVTTLFDDYAARFDTHLTQGLQYDIPRQMAALISKHGAGLGGQWDVLDLGCGTGLVGAAIAPYARSLVGVDLSEGMLAQARSKQIYTRLERAELVPMMRGEPAASYDVITSADVFIYVGKIDDVFAETGRLLRPGGVFSCSIEDLDATPAPAGQTDFALMPTGRFAHSRAYLERLASTYGLGELEMRQTVIRIEGGSPLSGYLALWIKHAH
jgi:predicted TPR repeat methyltransferase